MARPITQLVRLLSAGIVGTSLVAAPVAAADGAGNTGASSVSVQVHGPQVGPPYTGPTLRRLRLRPATISAGGLTPDVPRSTRLSLRLGDLDDSTRVRVELRRGNAKVRLVWYDVREGPWSARLSTAAGARHPVSLRPGRYLVVVRAGNRYGFDTERTGLRVVR